MTETREETLEAAVACTLGSAELGTQVERWRKLFGEAGVERIVLDDGLRVRFRRDAAVEGELRALVAVEVECCPWASWTIAVDGRALTLSVTSTGEGIPVIHSWFLAEEPVVPTSCC